MKPVLQILVYIGLAAGLSATGYAAMDMFLDLDGIDGEAPDDPHKDWIELLAFSHDISIPTGGLGTGSARTGTSVDHGVVVVEKALDKATPKLNLYCCEARNIPSAKLDFTEVSGNRFIFYRITLTDVIITSVEPEGDTTNATPTETVALSYKSSDVLSCEDQGIRWEYFMRKDTNAPAKPFVDITNDPPSQLANTVTSYTLKGTNANVTGQMWWRNAASMTTRYFTPGGSTWSVNVGPLKEKLNTVTVTGTNAAGTRASDSAAIYRIPATNTTPSVVITNGVPLSVGSATTSVALGGTNNSFVTGAMWWTNTSQKTSATFARSGTAWTVTVAGLGTGANNIYVAGSNAAGTVASDVISVTRSAPSNPPSVQITNATPSNLTYATTTFDLGGTNNANVAGSLWWLNTTNNNTRTFTSSGGSWQVTVTNLQPGVNTVYVYASNLVNQTASDVISLTRPLSPGLPSVQITNTAPSNLTYATTTYDLGGTNNANVAGSLWWLNTTNNNTRTFTSSGGSWQVTVTNLQPGVNTVYVYASNAWSNVASDVISLPRAASPGPPSVQITNATPSNLTYAATTFDLGGTNNEHVAGSLWWLNTTNNNTRTFTSSGGSWQVTVTNLQPGVNTVYVYASNLVSQTASDVISLTRPLSPTTLFVDITNATPATLPADVIAHDLGGDISNATGNLRWYNSRSGAGGYFAPQTSNTWSIQATGLRYGANAVYVYASNAYNQVVSDVITIRRGYPPGTRFVALGGAHRYPFTNWVDAANDIQSGVDAAVDGELVLVDDGDYDAGNRFSGSGGGDSLLSRLVIDKPVRVESLNGSAFTTIRGESDMGDNGPNGTRCVTIGGGAMLSGFTLTDGHTRVSGTEPEQSGGGLLVQGGALVSNCVVLANSANAVGGGIYCKTGGQLLDCNVQGNMSLDAGGGLYCLSNSLVDSCTVTGNISGLGGGLYCEVGATVSNSAILGNEAALRGGGVYLDGGGELSACVLRGNRAQGAGPGEGGGGAYCMVGGAFVNCEITGNEGWDGAGVLYMGNGSMVNCTVSDNMAVNAGGGIYAEGGGTHENSILFFNMAALPPFDFGGIGATFDYCCLGEDPGAGADNVFTDPMFTGRPLNDYRLETGSECIDRANDPLAPAVDLRGVPRPLEGDLVPPPRYDIGAHEFAHPALDSDQDGMPDDWEAANGLNPLDGTGDDGAAGDPDGDGAPNLKEYRYGTDPLDPLSTPPLIGSSVNLR